LGIENVLCKNLEKFFFKISDEALNLEKEFFKKYIQGNPIRKMSAEVLHKPAESACNPKLKKEK
jgi:hypothetical protein